MSMIELKQIKKQFDEKVVIRDFSLTVEEGEMLAITGKSGCGKSTLLNIMGGIEKVDEGSVSIFGKTDLSPRGQALRKLLRDKISFLFQNYVLSDNDTVKYNLNLALLYRSLRDKRQAMQDALETVGLEGFENQKVYTLSGGEQQRVAIARLLLKPTELVLADEPTGNLDEGNRDKVFELLCDLNRQGKTVVMVTHDKELARRCDRAFEMPMLSELLDVAST